MSGIRHYSFQAGEEDEDRRLDVFLAGHPEAPEWSRAAVQRLVRRGLVRLERTAPTVSSDQPGSAGSEPLLRPLRSGTPLRAGDCVRVTVPPPDPVEAVPEDIPLDIRYEDGHLLIVNKPAGLVVHPAAGHSRGTLVNALLARIPDLGGIGGRVRPGIVHRLDKDTSGLMVVAKTEICLTRLQSALQSRKIERTYLTLVRGECPQEGRIEGPIGRHPRHRKKMAVIEGGKSATTRFRVTERLGRYALLEVKLETGRTHQIRVHLAHRGAPVVGDPVYGSRRTGDPPLDRQALHAHRLELDHPMTGEAVRVEAPLPEDMRKALEFLRSACR